MGYNYGKEYAKWCLWKEKEEKLLRKLNKQDYKYNVNKKSILIKILSNKC